ncbi:hypothetical protein HW49_10140 [Porphyromonadaceae bacterium COT-184 OH4590]|nr:hypothetical protein HW49_10140 [Porphyromonadaceae bacterium COT-184 OH4590]
MCFDKSNFNENPKLQKHFYFRGGKLGVRYWVLGVDTRKVAGDARKVAVNALKMSGGIRKV